MNTTNDTLPLPIREKYELTKELKGGPIFVFPRLGMLRIDFSALTEKQAESLIHRGWPHIRRKAASASPTPTPAQPPAAEPDPAPADQQEATPTTPESPAQPRGPRRT